MKICSYDATKRYIQEITKASRWYSDVDSYVEGFTLSSWH